MTHERYKSTFEVVDATGRIYELQEWVTLVDEREGAPFCCLADGIPARRIAEDEFEIGMIDKVRAKRRSPLQVVPRPSQGMPFACSGRDRFRRPHALATLSR